MVYPSMERRLTAALVAGGVASMLNELALIRTAYAKATVDEEALDQVADDFQREGKQQAALVLLRINLKSYSRSSSAALHLADAEDAAGNKTSALQHFRLALKLDRDNGHAKERIHDLTRNSH